MQRLEHGVRVECPSFIWSIVKGVFNLGNIQERGNSTMKGTSLNPSNSMSQRNLDNRDRTMITRQTELNNIMSYIIGV